MRILLFFTLFIGNVDSQCISVRCNSTASALRCSDCSECRELGSSFCLSTRSLKCGCATGVSKDCHRVNTALLDDIKVCKVRETAVIPTPVVRSRGNHSIAVVVPRFFTEPPFDTLNPSRLTLLADYVTKNEPKCEEYASITAQKWGRNHCTLRIRLAMPGLEHKSEDHYYYDDQTPLESEFSVDMFEKAEWVRFFIQINVERPLNLAHETVIFTSLLRSDAAIHRLSGSPRSLSNSTTQTNTSATILHSIHNL